MGKIGENFGVEPDESQKQERGDRWSKDEGRKKFILHHWWTCHLKNAELEAKHQKYKSRVVLRGDIVKDDSGSYAVFIEQGSSASQMTAAKVMDVISRLLGCAGQAADAVSAFTQVKMEDAPKLLKFPKSECPDIWIHLPRLQMAKIMVQYGRSSRSSWTQSVRSPFWKDYYGKSNLRKSLLKHVWRKFKIGNVSLYIVKIILICVCGWHKIGWKETKSWSDVETTQQRGRFGSTIFSVIMYTWAALKNNEISKDIVDNYRTIFESRISAGESREITIPSKSSYFFILWHGWPCEEMCGAILWVSKQDDSTTLQTTPCIDDHLFWEEEMKSVGELSQVCSQIVVKWLYLARIGRPWYSMVSE